MVTVQNLQKLFSSRACYILQKKLCRLPPQGLNFICARSAHLKHDGSTPKVTLKKLQSHWMRYSSNRRLDELYYQTSDMMKREYTQTWNNYPEEEYEDANPDECDADNQNVRNRTQNSPRNEEYGTDENATKNMQIGANAIKRRYYHVRRSIAPPSDSYFDITDPELLADRYASTNEGPIMNYNGRMPKTPFKLWSTKRLKRLLESNK